MMMTAVAPSRVVTDENGSAVAPPTRAAARFLKFGVVGASGVVVNLVVVALCERVLLAGMSPEFVERFGYGDIRGTLAILAGIVVSIFTNFVLNDAWTWGDRPKGGVIEWLGRCLHFYVTNGVAAGLQFAVAWSLFHFGVLARVVLGIDLTPYNAMMCSLVAIGIATPLNFLVNHFWTFRER
jgi:putative flippase GtrA